MKNFALYSQGETYWISRSIAVVIKYIAKDNFNRECILAVQRGKGTPDPEFVGSWCLPCGYLDYDETINEAAARELWEETGIKIPSDKITLVNINDDPKEKRQNVTFRFKYNDTRVAGYLESFLTNKHSEKDEISDIKFIPMTEINNYKWAFNHNNLIKEL